MFGSHLLILKLPDHCVGFFWQTYRLTIQASEEQLIANDNGPLSTYMTDDRRR